MGLLSQLLLGYYKTTVDSFKRRAPMFAPSTREELVADGCLDVLEAVEFSGLSRSKLYSEMDLGRLCYVIRGRWRLIPKRELKRYLADGLRGGQAVER
jgi:hypothetical protein